MAAAAEEIEKRAKAKSPAQRMQARAAEWAEAEAEVAATLRKLEQRTGLAEEQEEEEEDDDDDELDIEKLRRQAKQRIAAQEGRTQYATRAGESTGVRQLEARLKGSKREYHPPVGATQLVDEQESAPKADD